MPQTDRFEIVDHRVVSVVRNEVVAFAADRAAVAAGEAAGRVLGAHPPPLRRGREPPFGVVVDAGFGDDVTVPVDGDPVDAGGRVGEQLAALRWRGSGRSRPARPARRSCRRRWPAAPAAAPAAPAPASPPRCGPAPGHAACRPASDPSSGRRRASSPAAVSRAYIASASAAVWVDHSPAIPSSCGTQSTRRSACRLRKAFFDLADIEAGDRAPQRGPELGHRLLRRPLEHALFDLGDHRRVQLRGQLGRDPHVRVTDPAGLVQIQQPRQLLGQVCRLHQPRLRVIGRPAQLTRHLFARPLLLIMPDRGSRPRTRSRRACTRASPRQLRHQIELLITRTLRRIHPQQPLDLPRHESNTTSRV